MCVYIYVHTHTCMYIYYIFVYIYNVYLYLVKTFLLSKNKKTPTLLKQYQCSCWQL